MQAVNAASKAENDLIHALLIKRGGLRAALCRHLENWGQSIVTHQRSIESKVR